ncbi:tRNA ligase [Penicillium taxi]|uniref:tRNA ligase n=1 Tax=Penicillium taxi TaxID=168475 RepID=UPI0025459FC7|nr:tRNA ligase [Penicillium taxi]KAJ5893874.1 tRNA ligase [Penicillium taxi]
MAQNPQAVSKLIQDLEEASSKRERKEGEEKPVTCKKNTYPVPGTTNVTVDSWKFMDWDYYKPNLPTYARGLFTTKLKDNTPEIAVRGYDKFFNVDEMHTTKWSNIINNTRGPYEVGVKENGCIIFIAGMEDSTLMVCSKHSIGPRQDGVSHAVAGESWVTRHVSSVGKSTKELAKKLRQMNATAVGELCDDSFEEHVLAYSPAAAGIYLHGLNYNVPKFATMSGEKVQQFADEWGFKKCKYETFTDIDTVSKFLEECSRTGTWDGRETEGFVVRCQLNENGTYNDWFFKYKFEEPYLMYRQWRECTKAIIAGRTPKIKKQVPITEMYLDFARKKFAQDPQLAESYMHGHGIISLRTEFLEERGLRGWDITAMKAEKQGPVTEGLVLAPIATLGCGKTTVAMALTSLFKWGHFQNDNLPQQKNKPKKFAAQISQALGEHKVVIADRNNHQRRERAQLMHDILQTIRNAKFVALNYVHEFRDIPNIKAVTRKRVLDRGDNHQSIRASSKANGETIKIMDGFLQRFESVDTSRDPDDGFDLVINLDVCASSLQNLETTIVALHNAYPSIVPSIPSHEEMELAINQSISHEVKVDLSSSYHSNKTKASPVNKVELFQIGLGSSHVYELLQSIFASPTMIPEGAWLYNKLVEAKRIQSHFHVTLIHRSAQKSQALTWDFYANKFSEVQTEGSGQIISSFGPQRVCIERLIWDHRVMAFVVRILPPKTEEGEVGGEEDVEGLKCANILPHITVGTADQSIKPKESNDLLVRWLEFGSGGETGIFEQRVPAMVLTGMVSAVMMR